MKKLSFKKIILFTFVLSCAVILLLWREILTGYASLFDAGSYTRGADAVLILSGNPETRVEKAVELYREGFGKTILLTSVKAQGKKYHHIFRAHSQMVEEALAYEKISDYTLVPSLKGGATSTFDEAYDIAQYAKDHHLNHIILVTDTFHTARALYAFKKVFWKQGLKVKLEAAGAENNLFNETNWWRSEIGLTHYILEPLKFLVYLFRSSNLEIIEESP